MNQNIEDIYPLSPMQQGILFHTLYEPGSGMYFLQLGCSLVGKLDVTAFKEAWKRIVSRHSVLRTSFAWEGLENSCQIVHRRVDLSWDERDWRNISADEQEKQFQEFLADDSKKGFDLARAPLMRFALFRLDEKTWRFNWSSHHLLMDGWCLFLVLAEAGECYRALCRGEDSPLPAAPAYREFIAWLQKQDLTQAEKFWREHLKGFTRPLQMGAVASGAPTINVEKRELWRIPPALTEKIQAFARTHRLTVNTVTQGAWALLLSRYTGEDDIVFGVTVSGRPAELRGVEKTVGLFINTLPMRVAIDPASEVLAWLKQLQEKQLEMSKYEYSPLVQIQSWSELQRGVPLFENIFVFENFPIAASIKEEQRELQIQRVRMEDRANYPLSLSVGLGAILSAELRYDSRRFSTELVHRLGRSWERLLEGMVTSADRPLGDLEALDQPELDKVLRRWNDTTQAFALGRGIHHFFEEWAAKTPAATAVVFEGEQLTFEELNRRANRVAHHLRQMGIGAEMRVGLCIERSLEVVVGILGILKAGAAYVPMDPEYPLERLAFIMRDAELVVVLTQTHLEARLPGSEAMVVFLDQPATFGEGTPSGNPNSEVYSGHLAYVLYTSGSTGWPKGIAVEHRQIVNYCEGVTRRLSLGGGKSFAIVSTFAADLGNTMLFPSLCSGGCLHVIAQIRSSDSLLLADYFTRHRIDFLKIVPSHLAALLTGRDATRVLPREKLILGGEASECSWVRRLEEEAPGVLIANHYGPTETTVGVLTFDVPVGQLDSGQGNVPLGRPLFNTQAFILDRSGQPVPVGVGGELYIAGEGLARGYIGRPDLTVERFGPNPFSLEPGKRMYRTGDRARYRGDGQIEFLGRWDHQVKIRGFRIELGEIESVLKSHPSVDDAAVAVHEREDGDKRVVGYVVPFQSWKKALKGRRVYKLPNNLRVAHINANETDYIFREIFELQAYLRHGITIRNGDCIFDVGANIGLFSVFANQICDSVRIYAFEPHPVVFDVLKANANLHGRDTRVHNFGLADQNREADMTFFRGFSLLSGFYADKEAEKEMVKEFMVNLQKQGQSGMGELIEHADELLENRFAAQKVSARLKTLSEIIAEENVSRIDLLKINVEKSELDVLRGIRDQDWEKIRQIVLEVDVLENLNTITDLLQRHGFEVLVEQDVLLERTQLCYVYAIRPVNGARLIREESEGAHRARLPDVPEATISAEDLRAFAVRQLPPYMVPSAIVVLESLPLTPNGKVDRGALAALEKAGQDAIPETTIPRTIVEEILLGIWMQMLRLERLGIHDNFFEVGGHSLLATQAVSRMREALETEVSIADLFDSPTVAGLAERLEQRMRAGSNSPMPALTRVPREQPLPLSFAQERLWFADQMQSGDTSYNIARRFQIKGVLNREALEKTVEEILRRHEVLRTTFELRNDKPVQVIHPPPQVRLNLIDIEGIAERDHLMRKLLGKDTQRPFNMARDFLIRVSLVRLSPAEHTVFLILHHIVFDDWSTRLLQQECSQLYEAFSRGLQSPLPELPIQYADFSVWQRQWLEGGIIEKQIEYWKNHLEGAPHRLVLPFHQQNIAGGDSSAASYGFELSEETSERLKELSNREGTTLFMTMMAGFHALLFRVSGQPDVVVGTTLTNRNRPELENLIGFFINTLPIRLKIGNEDSFLDLVRQVRHVTLEAYANQDLPFERIVQELRIKRTVGVTPVFQVVFTMYDAAREQTDAPRAKTVSLGAATDRKAIFDMTLMMRATGRSIAGALDYNREIFQLGSIEHFVSCLIRLYDGVAAAPGQKLLDIELDPTEPGRGGSVSPEPDEAESFQFARTKEGI